MNRDDIIRMAREASNNCPDALLEDDNDLAMLYLDELERFAALVAAAEREELKKLDWTALLRDGGLVTWGDAAELGDRVIAAIQARGAI